MEAAFSVGSWAVWSYRMSGDAQLDWHTWRKGCLRVAFWPFDLRVSIVRGDVGRFSPLPWQDSIQLRGGGHLVAPRGG